MNNSPTYRNEVSPADLRDSPQLRHLLDASARLANGSGYFYQPSFINTEVAYAAFDDLNTYRLQFELEALKGEQSTLRREDAERMAQFAVEAGQVFLFGYRQEQYGRNSDEPPPDLFTVRANPEVAARWFSLAGEIMRGV